MEAEPNIKYISSFVLMIPIQCLGTYIIKGSVNLELENYIHILEIRSYLISRLNKRKCYSTSLKLCESSIIDH